MYSNDPDLIKDMALMAKELGNEIVLIRPYGMENVPANLEELSSAVVGWNAPCVIDAIKSVLGEIDDEDNCEIF